MLYDYFFPFSCLAVFPLQSWWHWYKRILCIVAQAAFPYVKQGGGHGQHYIDS